jgi:orotate phosphoribosyltransferase
MEKLMLENIAEPQTAAERFVAFALEIGALELLPGLRKLKSGRLSPHFFNSGLFNSGYRLDRMADAFASAMMDHFRGKFDVVFGPAYKGIPIAAVAAMKYASLTGEDVGVAFNRKEAKDHGEGGIIIGHPLKKGEGDEQEPQRVLLLDDVISTGESKREAVEIVKAQGGEVVGCVIAFDRQEKGYDDDKGVDLPISAKQDFEKMFEVPLAAAATVTDLGNLLVRTFDQYGGDDLGKMIAKIEAYLQQYGELRLVEIE